MDPAVMLIPKLTVVYLLAVSQVVLGNGQIIQPLSKALPRELHHGSTDGLILQRLG
jgi:hypothetical protein